MQQCSHWMKLRRDELILCAREWAAVNNSPTLKACNRARKTIVTPANIADYTCWPTLAGRVPEDCIQATFYIGPHAWVVRVCFCSQRRPKLQSARASEGSPLDLLAIVLAIHLDNRAHLLQSRSHPFADAIA
jgi:hypothetical protein